MEETVSPKGTKFVIEIELTKDVHVLTSCIGRSIYSYDPAKQEIEGTFKINKLNIMTGDKIKERIIEEVTKAINKVEI